MRVGIARCVALLVSVAQLAACGSMVAPFEGVPSVYPPEGIGYDVERVSVCYNKLFTTPEEVHAVAVEACSPNTEPQFIGQDLRLDCPLMTPVRANFVCSPE
jgi:hypothetical protein